MGCGRNWDEWRRYVGAEGTSGDQVHDILDDWAKLARADYSRELPQQEGNYLWLCLWGCNCCVRQSGIAWVRTIDEPDNDSYCYQNANGQWLELCWEGGIGNQTGKKPGFVDGKWDVDFWLHLILPRLPDNET